MTGFKTTSFMLLMFGSGFEATNFIKTQREVQADRHKTPHPRMPQACQGRIF